MPIVVQIGERDFIRKWQRDNPGIQLLQALEDIADFIHDKATELAPGSTALAVDTDIEDVTGRTLQVVVGLKREPRHAVFVHEGTGVFGPYRTPIVAPRGNVFAFEVAGVTKFRTRIMGQRPQPFMREAIELAERTYIPLRVVELGAELT